MSFFVSLLFPLCLLFLKTAQPVSILSQMSWNFQPKIHVLVLCVSSVFRCLFLTVVYVLVPQIFYSLLVQICKLALTINDALKQLRPVALYAQYGDRVNRLGWRVKG